MRKYEKIIEKAAKTYIIDYVVGNTYKVKKIKAKTVEQAIKKARVKSIIDINIE